MSCLLRQDKQIFCTSCAYFVSFRLFSAKIKPFFALSCAVRPPCASQPVLCVVCPRQSVRQTSARPRQTSTSASASQPMRQPAPDHASNAPACVRPCLRPRPRASSRHAVPAVCHAPDQGRASYMHGPRIYGLTARQLDHDRAAVI